MKKLLLTVAAAAVLAGCSTSKSVEPIQQTVDQVEAASSGQCIIAIHNAALALEQANKLLAISNEGELYEVEYNAVQAAADRAAKYQADADMYCTEEVKRIIAEMPKDAPFVQVESLPGVVFAEGSAQLTPEAKAILEAVASRLVREEGSLEVAGHTSSTGSAEFNMMLSQKRAESVRDFLISQGVEASRLTAQGYGEEQPVATNETKAGQQANKRVEIRYNR